MDSPHQDHPRRFFVLNDKCAGGFGRFLKIIADGL